MSDEKTLSETLRIQAGGAGAPRLTLDDVQGRARRIRRTRAAVVTTGVTALVAAAVVPVALLVGGGSSTDTLPPADATPTVSDTANPVEVAPDQRGTWVEGDTIHPAVGEPFTPDVAGDLASVQWLEDGRWVLGTYPDDSTYEVVVVDPSGEVLATHDAREAGVVSDGAGGAVAWLGPDLRVRSLVAQQEEPLRWSLRLVSNRVDPTLVTVLPGCTAESCELVAELYGVSPGEEASLVRVSALGGVSSMGNLGLVSLTDISPDGTLASGYTSIDERAFEFCSAVVEVATGEQLWETCEAGSFRFSPDAAKVLGVDPYLDGFGHSFAEVRDALDGTVVGRYGGDTVFDETWASTEEFLVSQQLQDGTNQLLRVRADGSLQTVFVQVDGTPGEPSPLRLTGR